MIEQLTVSKCLEFAIKTEELGTELYERLALRFSSDQELHGLFEHLGRDELQHARQFKELHDRTLARFSEQKLEFEQENYLRAMSISEIFSGPKGLAKEADAIKTRQDALERALHLEKATLAYYQAVRDVVGTDQDLDSLIAAEKRHVAKVMQLMLTGQKFRGLDDPD